MYRNFGVFRIAALVVITICCTAPRSGAHETSWARPVRGVVLSIDRINDTIIFQPDKSPQQPWTMDLQSSTRYFKNGRSVSSLGLKPGTHAEVFYRTPIFGNRFIAKVIWNCDGSTAVATARATEDGSSASRGSPSIVSVWGDIHRQFEALGNIIEAKQCSDIPEATAGIREHSNKLLTFAELSRERRRTLTNLVTRVGQCTDHLEAAAAKSDKSRLKAGYKKLKKTLRTIAALYTPEIIQRSDVKKNATSDFSPQINSCENK